MMNKNRNRKPRLRGLAGAVAATAWTLAAGCAEDATTDLEAPAPLHAPAIVVPASAATASSLAIASWSYQPTADGVVVRGLPADFSLEEAPRIRFWISPSAATGERVAHAEDRLDAVIVPQEGEARGGSDRLRTAVTAFRADGKAAEKAASRDGAHHVNDDVQLCPGGQGTFTTWFWGNTTIQITNSSDYLLVISFQAGGAAAETHYIEPRKRGRYTRIFGALPVTVKHVSYPYTGCVRVEVF